MNALAAARSIDGPLRSRAAFISSIECRFPYGDTPRALELASTARSISSHAAFAVVDEVTRPPAGEVVSTHLCEAVLTLIEGSMFKPMLDIWTSSAQPWVCLDDAIPHFAESPHVPPTVPVT